MSVKAMDDSKLRSGLAGRYGAALLITLALAALYLTSLYSYVLFHSLAEIFSVVIACGIFIVAWNCRRFLDSHYLLLIGIAFLFVGFLDVIHTLAYKGMGVFPGYEPTDLAAQLWISTRYLQALSLLVALLFLRRKLNTGIAFLSYSAVTALLIASIFYWRNFPQTFVVGTGLTPFKVASEYVISLVLLCAITFLLKYRREFGGEMVRLVVAAMAVTIASEMAFTLYIDAYGIANMIGHLLKVLSYYLIYKALVETGLTRPYDLLFHNLKQREVTLTQQEEGLARANARLEAENTRRRQAESELAHLASFPELNPNPVLELDAAGNVKYLNPAARTRFPDMPALGGQHPYLADWEALVNATLKPESRTVDREVKVGTAWFAQTVTCLPPAMDFRVYGRDITERKEAEAALQLRTDELTRSNAELEQFAYIASHDLQEPLRMVSSYVQLLANRYRGKLDADADDFIHFATDGAARMQRLINDLLTYSRVGRRGQAFEKVDLENVLAQALDNLKVAVRNAGAVITHDPFPAAWGDGGQLALVFQNLIDNAIKFHGDQPPRIHISASISGGECACSVRDNGIGIDHQYWGKLFLLFQRLHTRNEYPGTGIGLAICKRIVERHGGRIWLESAPGAGSTFYFTVLIGKGGRDE